MTTIQRPPQPVPSSATATGTGTATTPPAATPAASGASAPAPGAPTATTQPPPGEVAGAAPAHTTPETAPLVPVAPEPVPVQPLVRPSESKDRFTLAQTGGLGEFVQGSTPPVQSVSDLTPNLKDVVTTTADVPTRFESDMALIRDQVLGGRGMAADDRARRGFEFFSKYAERFVEVANKTSKLQAGQDPRGRHQVEQANAAEKPRLNERDDVGRLKSLVDAAERSQRPGGKPDLRAPPVERGDPATKQFGDGATNRPFEFLHGGLGEMPDVPSQRMRFLNILRGMGYGEIHDLSTNKNGLALAQEMLQATSAAEVRDLLKNAKLVAGEFPPSATRELAQNGEPLPVTPAETLRELSEQSLAARASKTAAAAEAVAATRTSERDGAQRQVQLTGQEPPRPLAQAPAPLLSPKISTHESRWSFQRHSREGRLGPMMVWNVLHRFRAERDEETATAESAWSKVAVGAMLILLLTSVLIVALMNV